jgi:hypothetical protein
VARRHRSELIHAAQGQAAALIPEQREPGDDERGGGAIGGNFGKRRRHRLKNADHETADDHRGQRRQTSEERGRNRGYDHVGQGNNLKPHHVAQEDSADTGEHAGDHPGPGIDPQHGNANQPADLAVVGEGPHRQAEPAPVEEQDHPDRDGQAQCKGDRPGSGDTHPDQFEAHRVGRQPQAARPLAPNEFAEAEDDQRKAERRHRAHDGIAMGETRRNEAPIEQRQRRRSRHSGNPADPLRAAGIRDLPCEQRAQRTERALRQIEDSGSAVEHHKPNTGEDINRAGAEACDGKGTEVRHHSDLLWLVVPLNQRDGALFPSSRCRPSRDQPLGSTTSALRKRPP